MRKQLHGVEVTELRSPDGASAVVADHGAQLLSWTPVEGGPALYLSELAQYGDSNAIRGGVPIIFPQFSERGTGKRHGFARVRTWRQDFSGVEQGWALARYRLTDKDVGDTGWPHQFDLGYEIAFSAQELHMSLTVHNPSDHAWEFAAALHTYLRVSDIASVNIDGLEHTDFFDETKDGALVTQDAASLRIDTEVNRIYVDVTKPIVLSDGERIITVQKQGFRDVVVWNPWVKKPGEATDMACGDYRLFVCVEAGAIIKTITLGSGETWRGTQSVAVKNK
jgi:glucose-6-phosphate 1-epimerase